DEAIGTAGLEIEVDPPMGITILLDGERIASLSPWAGENLQPGPHRLEIRAMGYHTFKLPIKLKAGETMKLPVRLRVLEGAHNGHSKRGSMRLNGKTPPPKPPSARAPNIPPGVQKIALIYRPQPEVPCLLDGNIVKEKKIILDRVYGKISFGLLKLKYRIGGSGVLEFSLPGDQATWRKDSEAVPSDKSFQLRRGATHLRRVGKDGTDQQVILKRR
ncbi:carboxypeptidase regulatory-like domain-containing protein, partial [Myxococcota bacterium]|nr:carboxypeptidase regulatory-like domain-containing protein [Myxococcota bacterium]